MSFLEKLKNKKIKIVVGITVVSSLLIGVYYLHNKKSNTINSEENYVETYTIADNEKIFINGVILPTKSKEFSMPTEGEISKLNVTNGKIVKEGDVLFTVKNESIISEIDSLKSQINELKKSNIDNDPIINAEINKLESQVSTLNKKAYIDTTAPFAGKVYLNDQDGSSMITLQSSTFYMKGQTSEQDLPKLQIDDPVTVTILSTSKKVTGRVSAISDRPTSSQGDNMNNPTLSYYDIDISFEDQEDLVNGFHVQACIEITDSLCKIPSSSILKDENDKPYVFKSYDGILKKQKIEIQSQNDEFTVVKDGLDKQDIIIRYPSYKMNEGDAIPVDTLGIDTEVCKVSSLIKLKDINKYYKVGKEKFHVLKSLNINIEEGDFVMIMGKSGSGKTTLLNVLAFLDKFDTGSYFFNYENVSNLNENQRSVFRNKYIGFIFQQFNLIETLSIYQNVELPLLYDGKLNKSERENIVKEKLEQVGLLDKIKSMPLQLSGGQQQRVAIARSLVNNPKLIFADEPTGALDSETSNEIMSLLKDLNNQGKTIIMVTHDADLIKYATKVVRLKDGVLYEEAYNEYN